MSLTERDFESIIADHLADVNHFERASNSDFDKHYAFDPRRLLRFLNDTQPDIAKSLDQKNFLDAIDKALSTIGIVRLIRGGLPFNGKTIEIYQPRATEGNIKAAKLHAKNIFAVARQVHCSEANPYQSIDLVIFLNGLPLITAELKHSFSGSTVRDAVNQYTTTRARAGKIFQPHRALVHFAVSDDEIEMCTNLETEKFYPFNKGNGGGAGNPINPRGAKTAYLWEEILTKDMLANLLENYVQVVDDRQIFPRWHQIRAVENIVGLISRDGVGKRYLVQHSAGSGKSNSIAWLSKRLAELKIGGKKIFDSVIVVTDRINLDNQLTNTIGSFTHLRTTIDHAQNTDALNNLLDDRKDIITTTIQKFPHLIKKIDDRYKDRTFAIIIDEAHSSQGGKFSMKMNQVMSGNIADKDADVEDKINFEVKGSRLASNVSYIAFTATPKAKTLELFGCKTDDADGVIHSRAHDVYTMRQAIEEGFILDVLRNYTTYRSYFNIVKTIEGDPLFHKNRAVRVLRAWLNEQPTTIEQKARVMVDHFIGNVQSQIGGQARAMVVTDGINQAVNYHRTIGKLLVERNSPYRAIVSFTGKTMIDGVEHDEKSLNGFSNIEKKFQEEPYRLLIVADKFQTGYDEPLLQTMYVDKPLSGVQAVQTLSRLNRCRADKREVFVLDFVNTTEEILKAFERYYQTALMSGLTDAAKLNETVERLKSMKIFSTEELDEIAAAEFAQDWSKTLSIIDGIVEKFKALGDDEQKKFRAGLKNFLKAYNFLSCVAECDGGSEFAKLAMMLDRLKAKLPRDAEEIRAAEEIRKCVDLKSYRVAEYQRSRALAIASGDVEQSALSIQAELDRINALELMSLSDILEIFRREWSKQFDETTLTKLANETREAIDKVARDRRYLNAKKYSDEQNARIESDQIVLSLLMNLDALYDAFNSRKVDDWSKKEFRAWFFNLVFQKTYYDTEAVAL